MSYKCKMCGGEAVVQDNDGTQIVYCVTCGAKPTLAAYNNFNQNTNIFENEELK